MPLVMDYDQKCRSIRKCYVKVTLSKLELVQSKLKKVTYCDGADWEMMKIF